MKLQIWHLELEHVTGWREAQSLYCINFPCLWTNSTFLILMILSIATPTILKQTMQLEEGWRFTDFKMMDQSLCYTEVSSQPRSVLLSPAGLPVRERASVSDWCWNTSDQFSGRLTTRSLFIVTICPLVKLGREQSKVYSPIHLEYLHSWQVSVHWMWS